MNTYFISDLHFSHENCLAFDNRPFRTIEEHDSELIKRWNEKVGFDDDIWILGDISWANTTRTIEIFNQLNGNKHLCIGNHDRKLLKSKNVRDLFVEIVDYKEININGFDIILSHYPIPCFNRHYYGAYHFYGHVHISFEWNMMERVKYEMKALYDKPCNMFNVGCMTPYMNYVPRTFEEIISSQVSNSNEQIEKADDVVVDIKTPDGSYYSTFSDVEIDYYNDEISNIFINNNTILAFSVSDNYDGGIYIIQGKDFDKIKSNMELAKEYLKNNDIETAQRLIDEATNLTEQYFVYDYCPT